MAKDSNSTSSSSSSSSSLRVPILAATFALSGAAVNLLQQQLYYAGAGDESLLILIVPTFVGMIIGGLVSLDTRKELFYSQDGGGGGSTTGGTGGNNNNNSRDGSPSPSLAYRMRQILMVSVTDVTSLTLRSWAQNLCGSGMFTVIYASLPAFNGVLSYFFLGRILNKMQWLSMLAVIMGLAFSAEAEQEILEEEDGGTAGAAAGGGDVSSSQSKENTLRQVAFGIVLGLAGTFFSSASYVCAERVLKNANAPRHPTTFTAVNGMNDLLLASPWLLFYSIPHRQDLLYQPVLEKGQSPYYLIFLWCCLMFSNAAHLNSCYSLLRITESVTLTMLQGVRAVMVFVISGALFCSPKSPEQCLSTQKVLCSLVVIFGVVMYAKSTAGLSKHISTSTASTTATSPTAAVKITSLEDDNLNDKLLHHKKSSDIVLQDDDVSNGHDMIIADVEIPSTVTRTVRRNNSGDIPLA